MKSFDSLIGPATRAAMRDDRRIRAMISRIVPEEALAHVTFCRVAGRQLRVTLDSAAWIPRLRFNERRLLAELARDGIDVRTVSWHVTPAKNPVVREPARRAAATSSVRAAQAVLSAADSVGGDDPLARAMRRMARHLSTSPTGGATHGSGAMHEEVHEGAADRAGPRDEPSRGGTADREPSAADPAADADPSDTVPVASRSPGDR